MESWDMYTDVQTASFASAGVVVVAVAPSWARWNGTLLTVETGTTALGLYGMSVTNGLTTTVFLQVFDGYERPSSGAVPVVELKLPAQTQVSWDPGRAHRILFGTGIVMAPSSTSGTYTSVAGTPPISMLTVNWA